MINAMLNPRITRALLIITGSFLFGSLFASSTAAKIIGIDLGTTYSSVGVYKDGDVQKVYNNYDGDLIRPLWPSWVAFTDNETLIGEAAKHQAAVNPERTIFHVKRLIGRKYDDKEVQQDMKFLPYKIVNKDGKPYIQIKIKDGETKLISPEEIMP